MHLCSNQKITHRIFKSQYRPIQLQLRSTDCRPILPVQGSDTYMYERVYSKIQLKKRLSHYAIRFMVDSRAITNHRYNFSSNSLNKLCFKIFKRNSAVNVCTGIRRIMKLSLLINGFNIRAKTVLARWSGLSSA